jgi:hypothetical protein
MRIMPSGLVGCGLIFEEQSTPIPMVMRSLLRNFRQIDFLSIER